MLNELVDSLGIERTSYSWKRNYERAFSCLPSEIFFLQEEQGWTATFTETSDQHSGYSIHPNGRVLQEKMHLSKAQWQLVLIYAGRGTYAKYGWLFSA